jgi:hypothetical protein
MERTLGAWLLRARAAAESLADGSLAAAGSALLWFEAEHDGLVAAARQAHAEGHDALARPLAGVLAELSALGGASDDPAARRTAGLSTAFNAALSAALNAAPGDVPVPRPGWSATPGLHGRRRRVAGEAAPTGAPTEPSRGPPAPCDGLRV